MPSDLKTTALHWSVITAKYSGRNAGLAWGDAGPEIHRHVNGRITGNPDIDWVAYTLDQHFGGRLPLARCLSLGCGDGNLERNLSQFNVFQHFDAYDAAEGSLQKARKLATEKHLDNISYHTADINAIALPAGVYDSVWIHHAMHHFEALEHICQQIRQSLKPKGLLILNEYVGPNRFQFPSRQKEIVNLCLRLLPAQYRAVMQEQVDLETGLAPFRKGARWFLSRLVDKCRDGDLMGVARRRLRAYNARARVQCTEKKAVDFPSCRDVIATDPSEAIRSEEIVEVLQRDFDIVEKKDWGGNILNSLLQGIAGRFSAEDPVSQDLLKMLIQIEDTLLQCGELKSDFAYIVARPKQIADVTGQAASSRA